MSLKVDLYNTAYDYGSNYEFVRPVLMMDSTYPENYVMWRTVNSPLVHADFYIGITCPR